MYSNIRRWPSGLGWMPSSLKRPSKLRFLQKGAAHVQHRDAAPGGDAHDREIVHLVPVLDAVSRAQKAHERLGVALAGEPVKVALAVDGDEIYHHGLAAQGLDAVEHLVVVLLELLHGRVAVVRGLRLGGDGGPVEVRVVPAQHNQRGGAGGYVLGIALQPLERGGGGAAELGVVLDLRVQRGAQQIHKRILPVRVLLKVREINNSACYRVAYYADRICHVAYLAFLSFHVCII